MEAIALECVHCKARLKIKASSVRTPVEVKCPKCGKMIPVPKSGAGPAPAPAPMPIAPEPVAPPPLPEPPAAAEPPPEEPAEPAPPPAEPEAEEPEAEEPAPPAPVEPAPAPRKAAAPIVLNTSAEQSAMVIPATCSTCHWQTKVATPLIGKKIRCKQCGGIIPVVAPEGSISPAPAPEPAPVESAAAPLLPVPAPIEPVAAPTPPPPAPPKTKTDSGPVTLASIALQGEISELRTQLQSARHQADDALRKAAAAEQHAHDAEKMLHDMAGQKAVETMAANRKMIELENKVRDLQQNFSGIVQDYQAELAAMHNRAAALRARLSSLGVV